MRNGSIGLAALVLGVAVWTGQSAKAAVVCQKGRHVTLRSDACKPNQTQLGTIGGPDPTGTWELTGGTLFDARGLNARFLVLDPGGTGRLTFVGADGGVVTCASLAYARGTTDTLLVELPGLAESGSTHVYPFTVDADGLGLRDVGGRTASFARATAVDPKADCGSLAQTGLFTGLPQPAFFSGLPFDGTTLWYEEASNAKLVPVDPATGAAGALLQLTGVEFVHVHASEGGDFWGHCGCGGSTDTGRITPPSTKVDEFDTGSDLDAEISIRAIAFDPAGGVLWLHGSDRSGQGHLLKVDPGGEPDVLLQAFDLGAEFTGMAFDGTNLWGLDFFGQSLVRISPDTGRATGSFLLPDHSAQWQAVAVVGTTLFVLGDTGSEGRILQVEIPRP